MMRFGMGIMKSLHLKRRGCLLLKILCLVFLALIFCEFLVYYVVIFQCHWPEVKIEARRGSKESSAPVLKAMFLSDTHLLGEIKGHWLDKLRREWQMERAFQTALSLLEPDIVFILGDVFDEGKWSSSQAWADDVRRFQKMFRHSVHTELMVVVGNHDIGFHYDMTTYKLKRFAKVFNFTSGKLISRKGVNFVMVNSIALEGDGCTVCSRTEAKLMKLSYKLNCSRQQEQNHSKKRCRDVEQLPASEPILLQHYPLYRRSDAECTGEDSALPEEKNIPFKEKYDVLSREASQKGSIISSDFSLSKCFLPVESRIVTIYCIAGALLVVLILAHLQLLNPPFYFAQHLLGKHKAV
ncbi:metallophosphoesterase 1 isoform X2 [Carettochelys insculpta]|uniref:metallophosphoesterase 1 isoform X2 n=1 Tax=Carettochelys insculpta TaxID=44489 RepID=UPI003EBE0667